MCLVRLSWPFIIKSENEVESFRKKAHSSKTAYAKTADTVALAMSCYHATFQRRGHRKYILLKHLEIECIYKMPQSTKQKSSTHLLYRLFYLLTYLKKDLYYFTL